MNEVSRTYKIFQVILVGAISLRYGIKSEGRENIPSGGVLICANHSSNWDPIFIGGAFTRKHQVHFMAKAELFDIPLVGRVIRAVGSFPVDRNKNDVTAIKTALKYLKNDEKVALFPEGTRVMEENNTNAKAGAVKIAVRANVPILPVYIARDKKKFKKVPVIIGEPYHIELDKKTAKAEDYERETVRLMEIINSLGTDVN